jgi:signal transduction histidine kinase
LVVVERSVSERMEAQVDRRLEAQASAVARWLERARHPERLAPRLGGVVGARVTILDSQGVAVGDSREGATGLRSSADERELATARKGEIGRATRFSSADGQQVRYVAVSAPERAVVRLGLPIGEIDETKADLRQQLGVGALASLLVAVGLAALVAGPLTRRLRDATAMAQRIGAGDYDIVKSDERGDEFGILSQTLSRAAAELRETEEHRREFLATVAHEIRTPVTSIRGYAQMLIGSQVDVADRDEFANTIHRNAVRISQLVENLLELEALQAGHGSGTVDQEVDLSAVAINVDETLRGMASEQGASIELDVADGTTAVGNADGVERILLNLVDNALRHGGQGIVVEIRGRREGDRARITVTDNGVGIADGDRERIFERFRRGSSGGAGSGSGLGLAIARELARAMGGALSLDDSEQGARFQLDLPA